jgi:carbon monoxide dehydrogenase subunit G
VSISGSSTADIDAPLDQVWALVEDVESAPQWQGGLKSLRALDRDGDGRAVRCETETDAKVKSVKAIVRFTYNGPTKLTWTQENGDLKSVNGSWMLEDLGGNKTRATYSIDADLGRTLGLLIRGPVVDVLRHMLAGARAGELKKQIESSAPA